MDEVFSENINETEIDVRLADLTDEGVGKLVDWMEKEKRDFKKIKEVDLGNNTIAGTAGLKRLLAKTVNAVDVDIRDNKIGKMGMYELQPAFIALKHLVILSVNSCSIWDYGCEVVCNAAKQMPALRKLHVVDNYLSQKSAPHIVGLIEKNTKLVELCVDYNKLGDEGANQIGRALKRNTHLRTLGLGDNGIGDNGVQGLADLWESNKGSLKRIDLSVNQISAPGAEVLSKGLAKNTTLLAMDVGANPLYDEGAVALMQFLKTNATLTTLDMTNLFLTNESADDMVDTIKDNTTVLSIPMYINEELDIEHKERLARIFCANRELEEERTAAQAEAPVSEPEPEPKKPAATARELAQRYFIPFIILVVAWIAAVFYPYSVSG